MTTYAELKHGYTLEDLDRCARMAVRLTNLPGDPIELYEMAYTEAVIALYEADDFPEHWVLVDAARDALWAERRSIRRQKGYAYRDYAEGAASAEQFCKYWVREPSPDPSERITDALAWWQIMPMLTPAQQAAIRALAAFGDYALAAASLGITEKGFTAAVSRARRAYHRWWYEHETPPEVTRRDRRVWSRAEQPADRPGLFTRSNASSTGTVGNHRRWHVNRGRVDSGCLHCQQGVSAVA